MNILNYLERSAERFPDKIAFSDENGGMSYASLERLSRCIGTALALELKQVNRPVAVLIDRNVESICAFMGIVRSRNFYVPLDVTQPIQRIRTILDQMRPAAVISIGDNYPEELGELSVPVFAYEQLALHAVDDAVLSMLRAGALDTDPLYAICTSGSTGVPKGVLISHRSVLDFIPVFVKTFGFTSDDVFGNQAPFDFDVSVKDIYSTLFCGASMYIIPRVCLPCRRSWSRH